VVPSCHFISAITGDEDTHGVGLETFENENGECEPHNSFVVDNYNGTEMTAKVGAYVAPTCGSLAVLLLVVECCKVDGVLFGKCIPGILLLGTAVCQSLTFAIFGSDLFCSNKDIETCRMGETGYRSVQACLAYSVCVVLYFCSPMPIPFSPPGNKAKEQRRREKSEPDEGEDWTKEMYEKRRKEKKVGGRGMSGRSSKLIVNDSKGKEDGEKHEKDRGGKDGRRGKDKRVRDGDNRHERSITLYDPKKRDKRRGGTAKSDGGSSESSPKYDDYVDTDPDGMDWSAYTPDKREAHYDRQRSKKRAKREKGEEQRRKEEREKRDERVRLKEWERGRGIHADHGDDESRMVEHRRGGGSRDNDGNGRDSYRGGGGEDYYDDSYRHAGSRYSNDDDYTRQDSYYSDSREYDASGNEIQPYRSGNGRNGDYGDSYNDSYRSGRDSRDYSRSQYSNKDDYSYSQAGYDSYTQDGSYFGNDPPENDSYYGQQSPRASSKQSRSSGRKSGSRGSDRRSNNDSYTTYDDQRGHRDIV